MSRPPISHWNYRITCQRRDYPDEFEFEYTIREVYYDGDRVVAWTAEAAAPFGETSDELNADYLHMADAFGKPVIDITDEKNPKEIPSEYLR